MLILLRVGFLIIAVVSVVLIRSVYFVPLSVDCRQSVEWLDDAPHGALWKHEVIHRAEAPVGYTALVGWINAATHVPCRDESADIPSIEIRAIRIIERDVSSGEEFVAAAIDPNDPGHFIGRLFPRVPSWFGETEGDPGTDIALHQKDRIMLDLSRVPLRVYHAWNDPRIAVAPGHQYVIEIEANISKTARLQFGIDYWRNMNVDYAGWDPSCVNSTNCEGWVSDWYGDTHGEFMTFRAPRALNETFVRSLR